MKSFATLTIIVNVDAKHQNKMTDKYARLCNGRTHTDKGLEEIN